MNKSQIRGIAILCLALIASFLIDNNFIQTLTGALCAIGLGFIFKWIPFKKRIN
ncbi:hypothetical protein [Leeuwenhoekiella sp. NPDC079379]|uniref:hypothetical protein n=1 Tax=Leeuwenhoekiella sp. NPDC079379 TaxID=3364122 RepID=UPI0037C98860